LASIFFISAFKYSYQRAGLELIGDGGNILQALRLAEGAHEASTLRLRASKQTPLGENDGPGDQTERH